MWCPNCAKEYKDDQTQCPDCGTELSAAPENAGISEDNADGPEKISGTARVYVSKRTKTEDTRSTAYTFTIVSILGFLFLVLFWMDLIPLHTPPYMKVMLSVILGGMLVIFFVIGIRSFRSLNSMEQEAATEADSYEAITEWFLDTYTASDIDEGLDTDEREETLYFSRYEKIRRLLMDVHGDLEESFCDHIIESLYEELF